MNLADLERVNHLAEELRELRALIELAERADPKAFQVFIEAPGDASVKLSAEGATTAHERGFAVSANFLAEVKRLAVEDLRAKARTILLELASLGVEAAG